MVLLKIHNVIQKIMSEKKKEEIKQSNLDRYKKDLDALISKGDMLRISIQAECFPIETEAQLRKQYPKEFPKGAKNIFAKFPQFKEDFQPWYSEVKVLLKQLLPDRLEDFVRLYEKPKVRKEISYENYKI